MSDLRGQGSRPSTDRQRGQALVELALTIPIVVILALVLIQAGTVTVDALLLQHVARESARAAAVEPANSAASSAGAAASRLDPSRLSISLEGGRTRGERVRAVATYRSPTAVPLVGRLVGDVTLHAEVTMRVE